MEELESGFKSKVIDGIEKFCQTYGFSIEIQYNELTSNEILLKFLRFFDSLQLEHKLYILIDEYDNFTNAILSGDASRFKSIVGNEEFIKNFYSQMKEYVGFGVIDRIFITGICPITMDSMTTGFNIATNISLDEEFDSMIGLTHTEVLDLLKNLEEEQKQEIYDLMVKNYDGYLFSTRKESRVFNATLVMYFMKEWKRFERIPDNLKDDNIVTNFEKIKNIVSLQNNEYYESVLNETLKTGEISGTLKTSFDILQPFTEDDIISLLYYFGYLTIKDKNIFTNKINFTVPNRIMSDIYNNFFIEILRENKVTLDNSKIEECMKEIAFEGTIHHITNYVSNILKESDNRIFIKFDEKYIQLIYFTILRQNALINVYTEYPSKNGYLDLYLEKKHEFVKYNILIELKYIKVSEYEKNQNLFEEKRLEGVEQIKKYGTDERLESPRKYVVVFVGNEPKILEEV